MDPKFLYLVEEIMELSDSLGDAVEELKDGGILSGEFGRQVMKYGAWEIMKLKLQCSEILSVFMYKYGKDYADLCRTYSAKSAASANSSN